MTEARAPIREHGDAGVTSPTDGIVPDDVTDAKKTNTIHTAAEPRPPHRRHAPRDERVLTQRHVHAMLLRTRVLLLGSLRPAQQRRQGSTLLP